MINIKKLPIYSINFLFYIVIFNISQVPCVGCEEHLESQDGVPSSHKQGDKPLNRQLDSSLLNHPSLNDSSGNFIETPCNETSTNDLFDSMVYNLEIQRDLSTPITFHNDFPTVSGSRADIYFSNESPKSEAPIGQGSKRRVPITENGLKTNKHSDAKEVSNSNNLLGSINAQDKGPIQVRPTLLCVINDVHNTDETNNNDHPKTLIVNIENTLYNTHKK